MAEIKGVITAMVTPFTADGTLNLDAARSLARHLADNGSHGLVVTGTTGEAPTLSDTEKLRLLEAVLEEVGDRATVISGTGSADTHHTAELSGKAARAGAHALIVVTPYYNKPNPAGLRAHFETVAEAASDTPIVLYNIPSRCVINMPPDLLAELAAAIPNVVAVKQANNDDLGPIEGLDVLAGNDEIFLRTLEMGGGGGVLVASHVVGNEMRAMYDAVASGDPGRGAEINDELRAIYEMLTITSNPIPVKTALDMLGVIEGHMRLPMVPASEDERATIKGALERQGMLAGSTAS